jgi:predicted Zn-dependent protease
MTEALRFERAEAYLAAGYMDSARVIAEQLHRVRPQSGEYAGLLGELAARRGDRDEAGRIDRLLTTFDGAFERGQATYWRACIAALLGERDRAVDLLARALDAGYVYPARYLDVHIEPSFTTLRTDPRFQRLVRPTE